jgi:calcineurin-like phosphoesterase
MRILFIGDIMGSPGRKAVAAVLPLLRERCGGFDFVIANCENAAAGKGITRKIADELFGLGIDGMTSGNHIWDKPEGVAVLEEDHRIIRPANYPDECPGQGMAVLEKNGMRLAIANLQGRVFIPIFPSGRRTPFSPQRGRFPFFSISTPNHIGKKGAGPLSRRPGRCGDHTHVQTADEDILPGGTACITDAGMTGGHRSSIGMKMEGVLPKFLTGMPSRFEVSGEGLALNGVAVTLDDETGRAVDILRINEKLSH